MEMYAKAAWIVPLLPFAAFLLQTATGRSYRQMASLIAIAAYISAFILSVLVLLERTSSGAMDYTYSFEWMTMNTYRLRMGFEVTGFNAVALCVFTLFIALAGVWTASKSKQDGEQGAWHSYLSLFGFALSGLAISDNLLTFFVLWQIAGTSALLMAGLRYWQNGMKEALFKSFLSIIIGNAGFIAALLLLFWYMPDHGLDFATLESVFEGRSGLAATGIATASAMLLFLGAAGQAAQFPLHGWLPNILRSQAPTVSVLGLGLMGTASVFMVARTYDLFQASPAAMDLLTWAGAATAAVAALFALAQSDSRAMLGYLFISQGGFLFSMFGMGLRAEGNLALLFFMIYSGLLVFALSGGPRSGVMAWLGTAIGGAGISGLLPVAGYQTRGAVFSTALELSPLLAAGLLVSGFGLAFAVTSTLLGGFAVSKEETPNDLKSKMSISSLLNKLPVAILLGLIVVLGLTAVSWREGASAWLTPGTSLQPANWALSAFTPIVALAGCYAAWRRQVAKRTASDNKQTLQGNEGSRSHSFTGILLVIEAWLDKMITALPYGLLTVFRSVFLGVENVIIGGTASLFASGAKLSGRLVKAANKPGKRKYSWIALALLILVLIAAAGRELLV
ncbi:proton-conducting transporter transmembrane domain-containing protein [Paenibacillus sp. CAU 1782]